MWCITFSLHVVLVFFCFSSKSDKGVIHPGAQFVAICGPMKLENKFFCPQIHCWDKHRITLIDIPAQQEKIEGEKGVLVPRTSKFSWGNSIKFQVLGIIPYDVWNESFFLFHENVCAGSYEIYQPVFCL